MAISTTTFGKWEIRVLAALVRRHGEDDAEDRRADLREIAEGAGDLLDAAGVDYEIVPVHLVREGGEQHLPAYRRLNPQGLVPVLQHGARSLSQSLAILEYLEETWPRPNLLPATARDRHRVRAIAQTIACEIHPLNNLRVLQYLDGTWNVPQPEREGWVAHWILEGFGAVEAMLADPDMRALAEDEIARLRWHGSGETQVSSLFDAPGGARARPSAALRALRSRETAALAAEPVVPPQATCTSASTGTGAAGGAASWPPRSGGSRPHSPSLRTAVALPSSARIFSPSAPVIRLPDWAIVSLSDSRSWIPVGSRNGREVPMNRCSVSPRNCSSTQASSSASSIARWASARR